MQHRPLLAWVLLILLSLIWGSSFILIKRGLIGLAPSEVGALRIASAFVFLFPIALTRLGRIERKHWVYLFSIGFLGSLIPSFLFAFAQTSITSSVTGILNALTPLSTMIIGWALYRIAQKANVLFGVLLGFLGCVSLSIAGSLSGLVFNFYSLLIVLATICYGFNIQIIKHHLGELKALTVTSVSLVFAGPFAIAHLGFNTTFFQSIVINPNTQLATAYICLLGILGTAIALIIFNRIVQLTDPLFTSSVTYLIPLVALGWGLLDGEELLPLQYVGMLLILAGVYLANRVRG